MSQQNIWELKGPMLERQRRRAQLVNRSLKHGQCQKILDVGCAEGYTTSLISEGSYFVIGVDLNMKSLKVAKNKVKRGIFINASIDHLPFRDDCFDVVCVLEVLEHLPAEVQRKGLKEADRVLHSNGSIVISVPYNEQLIQTTCIHCKKVTSLYGHLHSLDAERISSLVPTYFKLMELYHLPNLQMISCANVLKPLPLFVWVQINNLLGVVRKGYWIILKYQKM